MPGARAVNSRTRVGVTPTLLARVQVGFIFPLRPRRAAQAALDAALE